MVMNFGAVPSTGMTSIEQEFGNLVDTFFGSARRNGMPRLNVVEYDDRTEIVGELPGVTKEDNSVTVEDGVLILKGERKPREFPDGAAWVANEIPSGEFGRAVHLAYPVAIDSVSAELSNGLLRIVLPKVEEARPKQIVIR